MLRRAPLKRKPMKRKPPTGKRPISSKTRTVAAADRIFSRYVRLAAADHMGNVKCFLCGCTLPWQEAVAMHCEPRTSTATRWSEINVQAGCHACNSKPLGDRARFRKLLDSRYGAGTARNNEALSKIAMPASTMPYARQVIEEYGMRLAQMILTHDLP